LKFCDTLKLRESCIEQFVAIFYFISMDMVKVFNKKRQFLLRIMSQPCKFSGSKEKVMNILQDK